MESFTAWLREQGLERYESAFRDNDIDFRVVGQLTEQDLKELGLTLGHRKLFLTAVATRLNPATANQEVGRVLPRRTKPCGRVQRRTPPTNRHVL